MELARQVQQRIPERLAETVERYTPKMPPMVYIGIALGATALLLWSFIGTYTDLLGHRAASLGWRQGDLHPPGV